MRKRDLLLQRYWRREDDGTYGNVFGFFGYFQVILLYANSISFKIFTVILYHSVFHQRCPPERGYVRACLKSNVCLESGVICFLIFSCSTSALIVLGHFLDNCAKCSFCRRWRIRNISCESWKTVSC